MQGWSPAELFSSSGSSRSCAASQAASAGELGSTACSCRRATRTAAREAVGGYREVGRPLSGDDRLGNSPLDFDESRVTVAGQDRLKAAWRSDWNDRSMTEGVAHRMRRVEASARN